MIGAIEILIVLIIFGIIYGKDAIDKTFRKRPDENVIGSLAGDVKDFAQANPKRLAIMVASTIGGVAFISLLLYWVFTRTDLPKMLGLN